MMSKILVTGLVRVGMDSETALQRIMALGYQRHEVSVIMTEQTSVPLSHSSPV